MTGWNLPPGVSGNEPQITGEWPCRDCGGAGYDEDEDGKHSCPWCSGSGIEPEDMPYCYNCETPAKDIEIFYYNTTKDIFCCNHCKEEWEEL